MKKWLFILFLCGLSSLGWSAGVRTYDKGDTTRVQQLIKQALSTTVPDSALSLAEEAYAISLSIKYPEGTINSLVIQGESHLKKNVTEEALRAFLTALRETEKARKEGRKTPGESMKTLRSFHAILKQVGDIYYQGQLYAKAKEYYDRAIENWPRIDKESLSIYLKSIKSTNALGQHSAAITRSKEALAVTQNDDLVNRMQFHDQMVQAYKQMGKYQEAVKHSRTIVNIAQEKGDKQIELLAINNLGFHLKQAGLLHESLAAFNAALIAAKQQQFKEKEVAIMVSMGIVYQNLKNYSKAVSTLLEARSKVQQLFGSNSEEMARVDDLLAVVYLNLEDNYNAEEYNERCIELAKRKGYIAVLARAYKTAAIIQQKNEKFEEALENYKLYFSLSDSLESEEKYKKQQLLEQELDIEKSERQIQQLLAAEELKAIEAEKTKQENELLRKEKDLANQRALNNKLEADRKEKELSLINEQLKNQRQQNEIGQLKTKELEQRNELQAQAFREQKVQSENDLLRKDNEIKEANLKRSRVTQRLSIFIGILAVILTAFMGWSFITTRKNNRLLRSKNQQIEESKKLIEVEKDKSDKLLLNILPEVTANELKAKGMAEPRSYTNSTVIFTDFKGFTQSSSQLSPNELLRNLDEYFVQFDEIIGKYNLEKIKTIGDAYMAASGIPNHNANHAIDAVMAAIEIRDFCEKKAKMKDSVNWEIRIGLHSGPAVAGVVGRRKFAYDIWGDTVNTASRMESNSEPGKINISEATYKLVKEYFTCEARGAIEAKGKGKIDMYFVVGKKNRVLETA